MDALGLPRVVAAYSAAARGGRQSRARPDAEGAAAHCGDHPIRDGLRRAHRRRHARPEDNRDGSPLREESEQDAKTDLCRGGFRC